MARQNKLKVISIPEEFTHPFFFEEQSALQYEELPLGTQSLKTNLFIYDIFFFKNLPLAYLPWNEDKTLLYDIFDDWQKASKEMAELFRKRDRKNAKKPMIEWIGLFIEVLYWCNNLPVPPLKNWRKEEIDQLEIKPVNAVERIEFLFQHPDYYHAYIQLNELFLELRKKYYKAFLLKK
ncbi:YpoC family protein [Bacillus taeanensis]|uniref:YpoC-like domain-containing protein n=1 Tax=Bacillus taeanensis TaxID=273032 RepID=A0A366XSS3_9BACI|nr:hypothetical protein [Bacillus taeanensis]RBW69430.1 hypothetical protein DS031_10925 [Bacillus taeanensis]